MADVTIPAAVTVISPPTSPAAQLLSGTVGLFVPMSKMSDQTYQASDADGVSPLNVVSGIAVIGGVSTGYAMMITDGTYDFGSALLTKGETYYLSHNAGKICPFADLVTGDTVVELGRAKTTSQFQVSVRNTGIVL